MKINQHIKVLALSLSCLCAALTAQAESDPAPKKAAPNGGRMITSVEPQAEFFVTPDRYAQITFLDAAGEVVAPAEQEVSLRGGDRSNPVQLSFSQIDGVLRSVEPLPEVANMPIILSLKLAPDAKVVREKFYLNQHVCGGCDLEEYACTCGH